MITVFTMSLTSVFAHTEANPLTKNFLAGSPHYYGEGGHPVYGPSWYHDHETQVGTVQVWNDGTNLYITIRVRQGEGLEETHVAVAESLDDIPQTKKGNPKVGQFPYKHENLNGIRVDEFVIPLADLQLEIDDLVVIAVHASLISGETAWADCGGSNAYFRGNNWATFFDYTIQ